MRIHQCRQGLDLDGNQLGSVLRHIRVLGEHGREGGETPSQSKPRSQTGAFADQGGVLGSTGKGSQFGNAAGGLAAVVYVQSYRSELGGERERRRAS